MKIDEYDWIFYKIYLQQENMSDFIVETVVKEAAQHLLKHDLCQKWFFIRYLDESGYHIRLRFFCDLTNVNEICTYLEELMDDRFEDIGEMKFETQQRILPSTVNDSSLNNSYNHYELSLYDQEYEKYGGENGIMFSEDFFQISSEFVVNIITNLNDERINRFTIGLKCMKLLIDSCVNVAPDFLKHYISYWSGFYFDSSRSDYKKSMIEAGKKRTDVVLRTMETPLPEKNEATYQLLTEEVQQLVSKIKEDHSVQRSLDELCFHYIHMMNNRLGIYTTEEAYLAALLLPLYKKKEEISEV